MDNGPQIDVEGIVERFRETIWKRGRNYPSKRSLAHP